jgi:peptidyl-prolyl cis-trans isomerase D
LAFILTDFLSAKKSMFSHTDNTIGEMNGKKVEYQQFEQKVNELTEIYKIRSGSSTIDDKALDNLRDEAWQQILSENVFEVEYSKLGLAVSPDELIEYLTGSKIHPIVRQAFTDPQTGEFNKDNVIQFLKKTNEPSDPQRPLRLYLENIITSDRYKTKYLNLVKKGLTVPTFIAKATYKDRNYNVDFNYIVSKYSSLPDRDVSISNDDLTKYYKSHDYLYKQTASRDLEYVTFDIKPSVSDTSAAREWIDKIKPDFVSTTEVEQFVNENSDNPYLDKPYKQNEIPDSLGKILFNAKIGDVYGPYFNGTSFNLARLYKKLNLPDSVKVRHILIAPKGKTEEDVTRAKALADSIRKVVEKDSKADFADLARRFSDDKGSAEKGGDLGWIKEGMTVKPFNDTSFEAKIGAVKLVESEYGYHIIQVTERSKEEKKVKIAFLQRKLEYSQQTFNQMYAVVMKFANENQTYPKFIKAIEKQHLTKKIASNLTENDKNIPGIESPKQILSWAMEAKEGEVSEPKQIQNQFIIASISEIRLKGIAPFELVKNDVESKVRKEKKIENISGQINKIKSGISTIQELGLKLGTVTEFANHITFSSYSLQNIGVEPEVIAYASVSPKNKISAPIGGNNGVYVLCVTDIQYTPVKDYNNEKLSTYYMLSQRVNYETQSTLIKLADINDKRFKFF